MSFKEIFNRVERTAEYWQERLEIEEGELRLANAENARLREALDDLVAWTGTAKDADHWLAKMDYANGVAKSTGGNEMSYCEAH